MKLASSGACRLNSLRTVGTDQTNIPAFHRKFPFREETIRPDRRSVFRENERRDGPRRRGTVSHPHRLPLLDVAEAGTGPGRFDADRYQRARFLRRGRCRLSVSLESRGVLDDMICRQHDHRRKMVARPRPSPRPAPQPPRCRVSPVRPRYFPSGKSGSSSRTAASCSTLVRIRIRSRRHQSIEPRDRFFEQRFFRDTRRRSCFGRARRLSGQKRSPLPPARINA